MLISNQRGKERTSIMTSSLMLKQGRSLCTSAALTMASAEHAVIRLIVRDAATLLDAGR
jgi:hypothetical protein